MARSEAPSPLFLTPSIQPPSQLSAFRWKELRKRSNESHVASTSVKNKLHDMHHSMTLDGRMKPELTVKPSALLAKREHYKENASKLRGEQFLDKVKGKKMGDAVFIDSLCALHNFADGRLDGTTKFEERQIWKPYQSGKTYFTKDGR